MEEYKVNDLIILKLMDKEPLIFVGGKHFNYSILYVKNDISPEEEFKDYCSKLKAWVDHEYDLALPLLGRLKDLALPLLGRLKELGDPIAKKRFIEEIVKNLESGIVNSSLFLYNKAIFEELDIELSESINWSRIYDIFTKFLQKLAKFPIDDNNIPEDQLYDYIQFFNLLFHHGKFQSFFKEYSKRLDNKSKIIVFSFLFLIKPSQNIKSILNTFDDYLNQEIRKLDLNEIIKWIICFIENTYETYLELNPEVLKSVNEVGIDILIGCIIAITSLDYEFEWKETLVIIMTALYKQYPQIIEEKIYERLEKTNLQEFRKNVAKVFNDSYDIEEIVYYEYSGAIRLLLKCLGHEVDMKFLSDEDLKTALKQLRNNNNISIEPPR